MDKLEIKRALLYNKPSILYRTVGPVETNAFPDRIDFYPICPSDRHVWESLLYCGGHFFVEETRVPGENQRPAASNLQTLSHNVVSSTPRMSRIRTHNVNGDRH